MMIEAHQFKFQITAPANYLGERLDKSLVILLKHYTRTQIQQWIKSGNVRVNGKPEKAKYKLLLDDIIMLSIPAAQELANIPQSMDLDIIYEDKELIIIHKPAGLVVHPGAGNNENTLMNGLLYYHKPLLKLPRAGIVQRLDKNTSGLMAIVKTEFSRQALIEQLSKRSVSREYLALVEGIMIAGTTVDQPIGRHPNNRLRMTITSSGKEAITHFRVQKKFPRHTLVKASLETGRTHQIRVHLNYLGYPIVGDKTYGFKGKMPHSVNPTLALTIKNFARQALHAEHLSLIHPRSMKKMSFTAPLPEDFKNLTTLLENHESSLKETVA